MKSYKSSNRKLLDLCGKAEVSVFRLGEEERCAIWVEAGMAGVSAAGLRGISAVISRVRDLMVMSDVASGRERI